MIYSEDRLQLGFTYIQLLYFGVHIGHDKSMSIWACSWAMFGVRNHIWLVDLFVTVYMLKKVIILLKWTISNRGNILFVNQKVQMSDIIFKSASRCGQAYSVGAWVGGALTNYKFLYEFYCSPSPTIVCDFSPLSS